MNRTETSTNERSKFEVSVYLRVSAYTLSPVAVTCVVVYELVLRKYCRHSSVIEGWELESGTGIPTALKRVKF